MHSLARSDAAADGASGCPELSPDLWGAIALATLAAEYDTVEAWARLSLVSRAWQSGLKGSPETALDLLRHAHSLFRTSYCLGQATAGLECEGYQSNPLKVTCACLRASACALNIAPATAVEYARIATAGMCSAVHTDSVCSAMQCLHLALSGADALTPTNHAVG